METFSAMVDMEKSGNYKTYSYTAVLEILDRLVGDGKIIITSLGRAFRKH